MDCAQQLDITNCLQVATNNCHFGVFVRPLNNRRGHYTVFITPLRRGEPRTLRYHELSDLFNGPRHYFSLTAALDETQAFLAANHERITEPFHIVQPDKESAHHAQPN